MHFDEILPHLVDAFRRGVLIPFIGSGMSRPACEDWLSFLMKLAGEAGVALPAGLKAHGGGDRTFDPSELYRLADKAVWNLRSRSVEARAQSYRRALNASTGAASLPPQTQALARLDWPLVLTTNYDDLYLQGRSERLVGSMLVPEVLGRSVQDCHKVIRSLDAPSRSVLWALQGFLGGQAAAHDAFVPEAQRRRDFVDQLVVGHQQYQNVVNAQPHFRRAFAEVFHRGSVLFLGSGLIEDYLVNLFGEIIHHYGPGPHPHFALVPEFRRTALDPRFLQTRLGIVPLFYKSHEDVPQYLNALADHLQGGTSPRAPNPARRARPAAWLTDELGFSLADGFGIPSPSARRFRLRYSALPAPAPGGRECTIASVGRDAPNTPLVGTQATGLLELAMRQGMVDSATRDTWRGLDAAPSYVFQFGNTPLFGVAARLRGSPEVDDPMDRRDLGIIPEAVVAALRAVEAAGFVEVHLGQVAAGQRRLWHPIHPFIQTLVGIRQYFTLVPDSRLQVLTLYVVDPSIWYPVLSGRITVSELLSSDVAKLWIDVRDAEGASEIQALTVHGPTTVAQLKALCGLELDSWSTDILPKPGREPMDPKGMDALVVSPTSVVIFSPRT